MIDTDKYLIIMWKYLHDKVEKKETFFDVKCSTALEDELNKLKIKSACTRPGFTKRESYERDVPLGGELAGHICYRDKFPGYDDGIYGGIRLIERLSHTNMPLSNLLDGINKYYSTKELKIKVEDTKKFAIVEKVREYCDNKGYKYITVDGIKVKFDDGFALVRASNTGPNITMRYESRSEERLKIISDEFNNLLNELSK